MVKITNCYNLQSEADYKNYSLPRLRGGGMQLSEAVLRTGKLEETLSEGELLHPASEGTRSDISSNIILHVKKLY